MERGSSKNEIAVITGTTHGIGRVTARELAKAGRTVVMLCRDVEAARRVRDEIIALAPQASVEVIRCDLASLESVRAAAAAVRDRFDRIGLLINNAGMVSARRRMSEDGFELTFATNHLGPFLLTSLLLERMDETSRIVSVASRAHLRCRRLDLDRVSYAHARYNGLAAYAASKLANVMHIFALARRLSPTKITANCLHPGVIASNLLPRWLRIVKPLISRNMLDEERGARTTLYLALAPEVAGLSGRYFDENQADRPASPLANDVRAQELLWTKSARWAGIPRDDAGSASPARS
jgi:NAD(P)-dependent dehydrogenase (short-subunit alcohol dehydrogenase family)